MTDHTMPNNYLICSEKFLRTKAPWKLNSSLLGQLSNDHYVASFDSSSVRDVKELATTMAKPLRSSIKDKDIGHFVFVGYGDDCAVLPLLEKQAKIKFSAAVLVDNTEPYETYKAMSKTCVFYNIVTKPNLVGNAAKWSKILEFVPSKLPAYMSSKISLTIASFLVYDFYKVNYLTKTASDIIELN